MPPSQPLVHTRTRNDIVAFAVEKQRAGALYPLGNASDDEQFFGSIDRFAEIAFAFRDRKNVLDVGSGRGILAAILSMLGHRVAAVDFFDRHNDPIYQMHAIDFKVCNIEADQLPFGDESFDAVSCCQVFEHFTHGHLKPLLEMRRVLSAQGLLEIDVPNAACMRNRVRMLRGKHITWDYKEHYLDPQPSIYKGREYYPNRHNREFVRSDLYDLLATGGFSGIDVRFLRDERLRFGLKKLQSLGSFVRNIAPSSRKSLIAFAQK